MVLPSRPRPNGKSPQGNQKRRLGKPKMAKACKLLLKDLKSARKKLDNLLKKGKYGLGWEEIADADVKLAAAEIKLKKRCK